MLQSSTLILKTSDIGFSPTDETAVSSAGSWRNFKQSTTYRVNLQQVIGPEIYNAHDRFILRLNMVSHGSTDFPDNVQDQNLIIRMSGLSFVNSTYDPRQGHNTNKYDAFFLYMPVSTAKTYYLAPNISKCQFQKTGPIVDITLDLVRQIDGQPAVKGTDSFPHMSFSFDIFPASL